MRAARRLCWTLLVAGLTISVPPEATAQNNETDTSSGVDAKLDALQREVDRKTDESSDPEDQRDEQPDDVDDQLDALEDDVAARQNTNQNNNQQSLNPDLSVILDAGAAWHANDPTFVGGPDPRSFGPFLQSVELAVEADVDPFFTFESHLVAGLSGLKVGEAFGTTLALPANLQVRFGKFKTQFGRVNPLHAHAWRFTALPLVNGKLLGPAGLNGIGAEVSQLLPVPWYAEWVLAVQDLSSPAAGRSFLRDPGAVEGPLDLVATARFEQFFELSGDWDLLWGLNAGVGRNDSGGVDRRESFRTDLYGTDLFVKYKPASRGGRSEVGWQTEAMMRRRQTPDATLSDVGGYSYLYWAMNRKWELGGRYEYVSGPLDGTSDDLNPDWRNARQRAGTAITFLPSNFSRLRLEYMLGGFDRDQFTHSVILQTQLVTGAHGAHTY